MRVRRHILCESGFMVSNFHPRLYPSLHAAAQSAAIRILVCLSMPGLRNVDVFIRQKPSECAKLTGDCSEQQWVMSYFAGLIWEGCRHSNKTKIGAEEGQTDVSVTIQSLAPFLLHVHSDDVYMYYSVWNFAQDAKGGLFLKLTAGKFIVDQSMCQVLWPHEGGWGDVKGL